MLDSNAGVLTKFFFGFFSAFSTVHAASGPGFVFYMHDHTKEDNRHLMKMVSEH